LPDPGRQGEKLYIGAELEYYGTSDLVNQTPSFNYDIVVILE